MQELQKTYSFNFGISSTIFSMNLDDADNILAWAKKEKLDIVFNMVRFTDAMLGNSDLQGDLRPMGVEEQRMRKFFLDRVRQDPLLDGQNYIYMHYADMIANGYHRLAPCPFQTQGVMLNPNGDVFFCENSDVMGNVKDEDPEAIYFRDDVAGASRHDSRREVPDLPEPVPDERRGHQAGRALREVPRARVDGETAAAPMPVDRRPARASSSPDTDCSMTARRFELTRTCNLADAHDPQRPGSRLQRARDHRAPADASRGGQHRPHARSAGRRRRLDRRHARHPLEARRCRA